MITTSAPSKVASSSRSHRGTPQKVTSGPNMPPRRVTETLLSQVPGHIREVVHVALHVVDRVLDRQGPVLFRAWRHQHPAVALVQPAQVRERLVDLQIV